MWLTTKSLSNGAGGRSTIPSVPASVGSGSSTYTEPCTGGSGTGRPAPLAFAVVVPTWLAIGQPSAAKSACVHFSETASGLPISPGGRVRSMSRRSSVSVPFRFTVTVTSGCAAACVVDTPSVYVTSKALARAGTIKGSAISAPATSTTGIEIRPNDCRRSVSENIRPSPVCTDAALDAPSNGAEARLTRLACPGEEFRLLGEDHAEHLLLLRRAEVPVDVLHLGVLVQAVTGQLPPDARLLVAAERGHAVDQVEIVDPDGSGLEALGDVQTPVGIL